MPFNDTWNIIVNQLKIGQLIDNWTNDNGYLGNQFTIVNIAQNNIQADSPSVKTIQSIPRDHFENVYTMWKPYREDVYPRHQIRELTRFSKYIISILHWVEVSNNDSLP